MGKGWQKAARLAAKDRSDKAVRRGGVSDRKEVARAERRGGVGSLRSLWGSQLSLLRARLAVAGNCREATFAPRARHLPWLLREARREKKNPAGAHIGAGVI